MINQIIVEILNKQIRGITAIYIFGSYSKGKLRKDSDIDIAVLAEDPLNSDKIWEASNMLSNKLKKEADLIDLRAVSTVMKAQVAANGECIYVTNKRKRYEFEMYTLSDYTRLNEERREIIERVKKEGLVYA